MANTVILTVTISLGNDAMQTPQDAINLIKEEIAKMPNQTNFEKWLYDENGNKVGAYVVTSI